MLSVSEVSSIWLTFSAVYLVPLKIGCSYTNIYCKNAKNDQSLTCSDSTATLSLPAKPADETRELTSQLVFSCTESLSLS